MMNEREIALAKLCDEWNTVWKEMRKIAIDANDRFNRAMKIVEKQRQEIAMLKHLLEESK